MGISLPDVVWLEQYLPLVWPGDMTAEEALEAAAADYITEATAQGYIEG